MEISQVIIKPYHSEKSYIIRKAFEKSTLTFVVDRRATKKIVETAFIKIYGVKPEKINIVNRKSQVVRTGTLHPGRSSHLKLAYIILPKGVNVAITKDEMEEASKAAAPEAKAEKKETKKASTAKKEKASK